jgi:hypothetical protein
MFLFCIDDIVVTTEGGADPCEPATNLVVNYTAECKAELTWNAPAGGADNYKIIRDGNTIATVATTSYTDDDFDSAEGHAWEIVVVCISDESTATAQTMDACQCPAPTNFKAEYLDCENVKLTWTTAGNGFTYDVYRDATLIGTTDKCEFTDHEFENTGHTWSVQTVCEINASAPVAEKLGICVGIKVFTNDVSIVPNPAYDKIKIQAGIHFHTLEMVSFLGQTILTQPNDGKEITLDISNLSNGVYFVRIISENGASVKKFVKQ